PDRGEKEDDGSGDEGPHGDDLGVLRERGFPRAVLRSDDPQRVELNHRCAADPDDGGDDMHRLEEHVPSHAVHSNGATGRAQPDASGSRRQNSFWSFMAAPMSPLTLSFPVM